MATKEGEAAAKEFILSLPEDIEGLTFSVVGCPVPPCRGDRTVLWVRAREAGGDWGQSAWVEVARGDTLQDHYTYRSKMVIPGALWMGPSKTYTLEVVPEGLVDPEIKVSCVRREPPLPPPALPAPLARDSALDNPLVWMAVLVTGMAFMLTKILG